MTHALRRASWMNDQKKKEASCPLKIRSLSFTASYPLLSTSILVQK
jgi:hexokinase